MIHLKTIACRAPDTDQGAQFPFTVPAIAALIGAQLSFETPVTFLIGENGSGKSTLLEALAIAAGSITVGSERIEHDASLARVRDLARALRLSWRKKTRRGFFMRAEDFFGYARRMRQMLEELEADLRAVDERDDISPDGKAYGRMPYAREIGALRRSYGEGLDDASHGESFFKLFHSRFVPDGLYLLDEPEAPLSPTRQIALLALLKEMTEEQGAQFIIATHSPILMAFPGARIYSFDDGAIGEIAYADAEHVRITREFLQAPQRFLRHL